MYLKSFSVGAIFSIAGMFPLKSCEQENKTVETVQPSPVKPELIVVETQSVDMGPLPKVCEPWKPDPMPRRLETSENPSYADMGLRSDRMICTAYIEGIECETFGDLNVHWYESEHLWQRSPDGYRTPYGSRTKCSERATTNDIFDCTAEINDQYSNTIEIVEFTCRGDIFCGKEKAHKCCRVKDKKKVFIQAENYFDEPSEEEYQKAEEERCDRLDERRKTCEPFCTNSKYSSQCANYWGVVCPNSVAFSEIFTRGM